MKKPEASSPSQQTQPGAENTYIYIPAKIFPHKYFHVEIPTIP